MPRLSSEPIVPESTERYQLYLGNSTKVLKQIADDSIDAVVTDPPAAIGFMGKEWDHHKGGRQKWIEWLSSVMSEVLRILKPGAFGLVWALPRTSHWTATALEDTGFEIRDRVAHIFGQGFPKGKSCLKPAVEDWWLVRNPGKMQPLQVDKCRIACDGVNPSTLRRRSNNHSETGTIDNSRWVDRRTVETYQRERPEEALGRWPANLAFSHSPECDGECSPDCPVQMLDEQSGNVGGGYGTENRAEGQGRYGVFSGKSKGQVIGFGDTGGASRFFYCSKASRRDRGDGNNHPTTKNTKLMEWLVKLITPLGGTVIDPFMGSGSTGIACLRNGMKFIGIEIDRDYYTISQNRLKNECYLIDGVPSYPLKAKAISFEE